MTIAGKGKYIAFLLTSTLFILVAVNASGLDAPHNETNDYGCDSCHDVTSNLPKLMPPDLDTVQDDLDDTLFNTMCWSCHNPSGDAPDVEVKTHSSLQTDTDYGQWTVDCWVCHNTHSQQQQNQTPANYGKLIRKTIDLSDITYADATPPKSGRKNVKFPGPDSFTDIDGVGEVEGVCQVCHTKTTHWLQDGSKAGIGIHNGLENSNCMSCHSHAEGFKAACDVCHGFPPIDNGSLVSNPSATGSTTSGAHAVHAGLVNNNRYPCTTCHFNGMPATPVSGNNKIQIGFSGVAATGADGSGTNYKGHTLTSHFSYEQTNGTTVTVDESMTCENIYCHSTVQGATNPTDPPIYNNPTWDDTFGMRVDTCNNRCHTAGGHLGTTKGTVLTSGSHGKHLQFLYDQKSMCQACHYFAEFQLAGGVGCDNCHNNRSSHPSHVNQEINVLFNEEFPYLTTSTSGTYTGTASPGDSYGSCSALYCHSPGNKASAPYDPPNNTAITWGGTLSGDCSDCHGGDKNSNTPLASGSHSRHITYPFDCSICHLSTAEDSRTYSSLQYETKNYTTGQRYHADGLITISYNSTITGPDATYDGRPQWLDSGIRRQAGRGYGDCNNVYCHSIIQTTTGSALAPNTSDYKTPTWGGTSLTCSDCHSSTPPSGSHSKHLAVGQHCSNCHYSALTPTQICTPCHVPHNPALFATSTAFHVNNEVNVDMRATGFIDGTYTGSKIPADGFSTCDNTYCHSNGTSVSTGTIPANISPVWGTTGPLSCDSCHEYGPTYGLYSPKANSHVRHDFLECQTCHYTTTTNGTTIANNTTHVNGQYNVSPSPTFFANGSDRTNTFDYVYDTGGGTCSNISCHTYWTFDNNKKWGGASLTPSSIGYNLTDQGDYGVTVYVGSPTCFPEPDSTTCPAPFTYIWQFSDGYSETTTIPSIHYEFGAPGTYTVTLTQTAANGLSGTRTSGPFDPLPPPPPTPQYNPQTTLIGSTVTVTVVTDPPNPDIGKIDIWWNGTGNASGDDVYISFPATMQHTYLTPGTYTIRVRVTTDPARDEYEYEWNSSDCSNCPTLQVTVP